MAESQSHVKTTENDTVVHVDTTKFTRLPNVPTGTHVTVHYYDTVQKFRTPSLEKQTVEADDERWDHAVFDATDRNHALEVCQFLYH